MYNIISLPKTTELMVLSLMICLFEPICPYWQTFVPYDCFNER